MRIGNRLKLQNQNVLLQSFGIAVFSVQISTYENRQEILTIV